MTELAAASKSTFRTALGQRDFLLLWSGQSLSAIGNQVFPVALATLLVDHGVGATRLGQVLAAQTVALVVGVIAAAAVGDRWSRVRLMMTADAVRMVAVIGIALLANSLSVLPLLTLVVFMGFAEGLFQPAFAAAVSRIIEPDLWQPANGLNSFSQFFAMVIGPGLAGLALSLGGSSTALWLDAATFPASLLTLWFVRERPAPADSAAGPTSARGRLTALRTAVADFRGGVGAVVRRPWLGVTIVMSTVIMTLAVPPALVLIPIESRARLGGNGAYEGAMIAIGVGSVIGAIVAGRIRTRRPGVVALAAQAGNAAAMVGLALFTLPGVLITWAISGAGVTIFEVLFITAIQREVPDSVLARVMAINWLGNMALTPLGYALTGPVSQAIGDRPLLLIAAAVVILVVPLPLLTRGGTTFATPPPDR